MESEKDDEKSKSSIENSDINMALYKSLNKFETFSDINEYWRIKHIL